ncbi:MAG TPA: hypothetical protein VNT54_08115, partial [Solirubrobacteraceae bacterium]|nr:hypothetical protein [Solirubrobacteraceae bacterium]
MKLHRVVTLFSVLALSVGVAACGDDDDDDAGAGAGATTATAGGTKTIYSSLPLQGASRPQTTAMVSGIRLAMKEAGNKAGNFTIRYQSLDDSTAQQGGWTPEAVSQNARKA